MSEFPQRIVAASIPPRDGRYPRKIILRALGFILVGWLVANHGGDVYRWAHYHVTARPAEAAMPDILRDLPAANDTARAEFAARVAAHFRDGMSETDLSIAMQQMGFTMWSTAGRRSASFVRKEGFCLQQCTVHWSIGWGRDDKGRATNIASDFGRLQGFPGSFLGELSDHD